MKIRITAVALITLFVCCSMVSANPLPTEKVDSFGDSNCEDEMARLDNFAVRLQQEPSAKGVIIFYGGRRFRGRLPTRGEAAARAARIMPYLVQRRGIPADQVTVINGGFTKEWRVDLWLVPAGAESPTPTPTIRSKNIKFRSGKPKPRDYRCRI